MKEGINELINGLRKERKRTNEPMNEKRVNERMKQ
jgi:hypothetical protein